MYNSQMLLEMSQIGIEQIDPSELADVRTIRVNHALPHEDKVRSVIERMGNPYCFLSGDVPVRVRFSADGKPLSDVLSHYFSLLKQK